MKYSICVFCGASQAVDESYFILAASVGRSIAQRGHKLIYGGSDHGMMGALADAALEADGDVIGILPVDLCDYQGKHHNLTELHVVKNFFERKQLMAKQADMYIVLPGGIGTLDELLEFWTHAQLGFTQKPILILNLDGFYDKLLSFVQDLSDKNFCSQTTLALLTVVNSLDELNEMIKHDKH